MLFCPFTEEEIRGDAAIVRYMHRPHRDCLYYTRGQQALAHLLPQHNNCLGIIGHDGGRQSISCKDGSGRTVQRLSVEEVIDRVQGPFSPKALHRLDHVDVVSCYAAGRNGQN